MKSASTTHHKKISALSHTILTLVILSIIGWLILFGWVLFIWVSQDFESACRAVQHLSANQILHMTSDPFIYESTSPLLNDVQHDGVMLWVLIRATSYVMYTKLVLLISATPLFFLCLMVGLIDGLNQRAIRAACLGRESTYVFHKSVPLARKIMCLVLGLWLCVPLSLPPSPIFVGLAVILGFAMRVSASRFKKYL